MILKKIQQRDQITIHNVPQALDEILAQGHEEVLIQPSHILAGEEYEKLLRQALPYYKKFQKCTFSTPLLGEPADFFAVVQGILPHLPAKTKGQALVFMGHGSAHSAHGSYETIQKTFHQAGREDIFLATVEGASPFLSDLDLSPYQNILLHPFMWVAGEHAKKDMAGDWKDQLEAQGYQVTCILKGLGEYPSLRQIFCHHSQNAVAESQGMLYGVGVGSGDPELLTLKALRILQEADIICVPDKGKGDKTALHIVRDHVKDKKLLFCPTPMVRDQAVLDQSYEQIALKLAPLLSRGKKLAFLTLGDPTLYSTYMYVHQRVVDYGFSTEIIAGVPSFCAVSARLGKSLCERNPRLLIVPASHDHIEDALDFDAHLVLMKAGKDIQSLQKILADKGLLDKASMVANCGMEGEQVFPKFADMTEQTGYFSLILIKK